MTMWSVGGRADPAMTESTDCPPPPGGFGVLGRRNRLIWQLLSLIWLTVLVVPLSNVLDSSYSVAEKLVLGTVAAGFVVGYLLVLRPSARRRPDAPTPASR